MIKKFIAALILTFPVYAFVGGSDLVTYWFSYGNGWDAFEPLLKVLQEIGFSGRATMIYGVMLVISFILSVLIVFGMSYWLSRK